ncbi:TPA_asm: N [Schiedea betacytorhabdovirus 1]|nr:TPA_asm: N [Schiedea betacytorhabdovirus 1]
MSSTFQFSGIPEDTVTSLTTAEKWKDSAFDSMVVYNIAKRGGSDLIRIFNSLIIDMCEKEAGKATHLKALVLAVHLGKPSSENWEMINELESFSSGDEPNIGVPPVSVVPDPEYEDEDEAGIDEAEKEARKERNRKKEHDYRAATKTPFSKDRRRGGGPQKMVYSESNLKYATFLGALLMKMITKEATNLGQSWTVAKDRFKGFYLEEIRYDMITPSTEWLSSLKVFLNHDKRAIKTVLKWTVSSESKYSDPDSNEAGILRYLFSLPLSYTGMHAYKLFLAVKSVSGKRSEYLLNALIHPKTIGALKEIENILKVWESRVGASKSTKFRYSRLVGPQYFMALQTKQCPALVYCLVMILREYSSGDDSGNFRPDNIVGIQSLSKAVQNEMSIAAKLIAGTVTDEESHEYSPFMIQARASFIQEKIPANDPKKYNPFQKKT